MMMTGQQFIFKIRAHKCICVYDSKREMREGEKKISASNRFHPPFGKELSDSKQVTLWSNRY